MVLIQYPKMLNIYTSMLYDLIMLTESSATYVLLRNQLYKYIFLILAYAP